MTLKLLALGALTIGSAHAVTLLSAATINGGDTTTASFDDGSITLTPFIGGVASTFNPNAVRLGIDEAGTNVNAFNDPDVMPNNGNEERLEFSLIAGVGLSQISYDFSRADGPGADDGVIISGFSADPNVTFSISDPNLFAIYAAGTVRLNIPGSLFNGTETFINFDAAASDGQDLNMIVTDTTQAGAQFAIRSISYDDVVPEPSTALLSGLAALGLLRRRR